MPRGDTYVHVHRGISDVQRRWSKESRPPVLLLKDEHRDLLAKYKAKIGMAENDWHVCLHVRSQGFHSERRGGSEDIRNAPIEDYYPLIRDVIAAGGWVVRMGDSSMPALDMSKCGGDRRVVDFALSSDKSAALDVALGASCRLFVGHSSGFHTIPHAFGRPCCMVNIPLTAGFPWHPDDVFVPKKYVSTRTGMVLSLAEILSSSQILNADNKFQLAGVGVILQENEPDELTEAARESLGGARNLRDGSPVVAEFDRLNQIYGAEISGNLSRYYAAKHAAVLVPAGDAPGNSRP
jgi:putative glycosyltransferase (TIGR04372 family)